MHRHHSPWFDSIARLCHLWQNVCNKKVYGSIGWLKSDVFDEGISGFWDGERGFWESLATVFKQTIELLRCGYCGIVSGKQFDNYEPHNHVYNDVCAFVLYSIV